MVVAVIATLDLPICPRGEDLSRTCVCPQTNSIARNVEASNLWSFYQAKTLRQTTLKTAAEQMEIDVALAKDPAVKERLRKRRLLRTSAKAAWKSFPSAINILME